jgi:dynein heavy chain
MASINLYRCSLQYDGSERRQFGPLEWAIPYQFNASDFSASLMFMADQNADATKTSQSVYDESFWQTVRYGVCEIHYGGRVTDELDQRLVKTIGEHYFSNSRAFVTKSVEYQYFDGVPGGVGGKQYPIVDCTQVSSFLERVNQLPNNDPPEVFGLHSLAAVKLRRDQVNEIFQKIIDVQPKESSVGGIIHEDVVLQKIHELLPGVPLNFDMDKIRTEVDKRATQLSGDGKVHQPLDVCAK